MANDSGFREDITIVLLGCTGSGKSATGNSILGEEVFRSDSGYGSVTTTCRRRSTVLPDRRVLHVIDTPGLFDSSRQPEETKKEIVRCIDMARNGIHAVLIVVSLSARFTDEQAAVVETLKHLFGARIVDYMIVAFTGGDELEDDNQSSLDLHLASSPKPLKELLDKCGNRRVVFDNTLDAEQAEKKAQQREQLLTLIDKTLLKNGGKPYTHELFSQLKNETAEKSKGKQGLVYVEEEIQRRIAIMVNEKLKERDEQNIKKLRQDLQRLRNQTNEQVKGQKRNFREIRKLRRQLEQAERALKEPSGSCSVL